MPTVAALSVSHKASALQKKFRGSLVICLSAVVENPFDIFFFSFLEWMACRFSKVKIDEDEKVGSNKTEMIEALECLELK